MSYVDWFGTTGRKDAAMTTATRADDLVERYVHSVLVHLPRPRRAAAEAELRARIEAARTGGGVEDALTGLGPPEDLARRYRGAPRQLIGPRLYDTYLRILLPTLRTGALLVGGLTLLAAVVDATTGGGAPPTAAGVLGRALGAGLTAVVYLAFGVTAVFAVLERTAPGTPPTPWKPGDLPPVPRDHEIPRGDAVADLVFAVAVLAAVLCLFPALAPPFLRPTADALDSSLTDFLLPAGVVVAVLWVAVAILALAIGRWTLPLTALSACADLLAVLIAAAVLAHRPYFTPEFLTELDERAGPDVRPALKLGIGAACALVIVVCVSGIVTAARGHLAHRRE